MVNDRYPLWNAVGGNPFRRVGMREVYVTI
jgi:hypothetical protein